MKNLVCCISFLLVLTACSEKKQHFKIEGTVSNRMLNGKNIIFRKSVDGNALINDTLKIQKSAFAWKGSVKAPEVRNVLLPETGAESFLVVLEKGDITINIDGDTALVGGTPLNEILQARVTQNRQNMRQLMAIDNAYMAKADSMKVTPEEEAAYQAERTALIVQNTDNIIAFIKENIDNVVGKYFFMKHYLYFPRERKDQLKAIATDDLKALYGIE
ncbi:MAG: DUF4369 domain-containing protein [Dysgonamonadaceae bacterium]|jgi:hypothetical protein|nr:DUF4369 domain-containing protein [Dysgonamonadaceae bacterium]